MRQFIKKCQDSPAFFISTFGTIKHPTIGELPFNLFNYQKNCLKDFRNHRFNIFKKCRQSGISTLAGNYALWMAMFFPNRTILVVSKRDEDAKDFLEKNVKFSYRKLPKWMKKIWEPETINEHNLKFTNGSLIRSLTSSPDTLRSNAATLNIIDEAAFIDDMETMWSGGYSTLQMGGSVIVISTTNGIGGWYYNTWMDSIKDDNNFNPIEINWWDMDWVIEYQDPIRQQKVRIAPTDDIRKCETKEEIEKWGPYWSPWLENEYRGLVSRGEGHLFEQELLARFVGGGGTILKPSAIETTKRSVENAPRPITFDSTVEYVNEHTGDHTELDFSGHGKGEGLWMFGEPVQGKARKVRHGKVIDQGKPSHTYVMGVDVATGEASDYSAIQIFDLNTMEQVAEYMGRVQLDPFAKMVDYLGRYYNNALACVERSGVGKGVVQDLIKLRYPRLWRSKNLSKNGLTEGVYGFATTDSSKGILNKTLQQNIPEGEDESGYKIYSQRLLEQFQIYVRIKNKKGIDTKKTGAVKGSGNHDDLVIATALAFVAAPDVGDSDPIMPVRTGADQPTRLVRQDEKEEVKDLNEVEDYGFIMPVMDPGSQSSEMTQEDYINQFSSQLVSGPQQIKPVSNRKYNLHDR